MKKVISFCIWGNDPKYNVGAIRNAEIAKELYPDFECWFYIHEQSVLRETIEKLSSFDNTKVILKEGDLNHCKPMMWRYLPIDEPDVEVMLSRDTDSRINLREKHAVDEWLSSNTLFHIMRDHPHHGNPVMGGMFGTKKIPQIPSWAELMNRVVQHSHYQYDQSFLADSIYPVIVNNSVIHASFHRREGHAKNFPTSFDSEYRFVGEYIYADESCNQGNRNQVRNGYI